MRVRLCAAAVLTLAGCAAGAGGRGPMAPQAARHVSPLFADVDPTVRGAHLVPDDLTQARAWGEEPGGGTRAIVAGMRVVDWVDGAIVAASDRLPAAVAGVTVLPERMGGGFLFTVGPHLWRSNSWLGPARPFFTSPWAIGNVYVGLDRVYVRTQAGALGAIDPRTGRLVDLGPIPASPSLGRIAALDAWRAVAVTDLRGAELTLDAGSTWRPLALPIEPSEVVALQESIVIGGMNEARQAEWWEVGPEGQVGRLAAMPSLATDVTRAVATADPVARIFGDRPLVTAIEDGWPLHDGTVLVARDGALARIRLSDGAVAETAADAFPLRPSRCHPVSLARRTDAGAFGFVCGEPRGRTAIYRWDADAAGLVEERGFDDPRQVIASGNGALAVRGPCAAESAPEAGSSAIAWCVMAPGKGWREIRFRGDDVDQARVIVLSDGRVALLRAPRGGDLSTARLTLTDGSQSTHRGLVMPEIHADVAQALRLGVWMDGFEERRPGVLGGWVDAAGAVVGIEVDLDGQVRVGEYMRDAGAPFVSGRWAFGWTASRRGFETTDGGMTWSKQIEMPDPIAGARDVRERACGPVGCLVAGWMRIGWGVESSSGSPKELPPPAAPPSKDMPSLELFCQPTGGPVPVPPSQLPPARKVEPMAQGFALPHPWMVGSSPALTCATDLAAFQGHAAPLMSTEECGLQLDTSAGLDRPAFPMGLTHVYAWGSKSGDWDAAGKWKIAWLWPWGGWPDARASVTTPAPWTTRDAAGRFLGLLPSTTTHWTLMPADDPDHALLLARRTAGTRSVEVWALESDRAPVEVRGPSGDPFGDVQGATRAAGRWYLATAEGGAELPATIVWSVDGGSAREIARLPRIDGEAPAVSHLGHRIDGGAVGLVVQGQPGLDRGMSARWVVAIDLESGAMSDPQPLSPVDLNSTALACTGDDDGWVIDLPYTGTVRVHAGPSWSAGLAGPVAARLRLSHTGACLERVTGTVSRDPEATVALTTAPSTIPPGRFIQASVYTSNVRYGLRCRAAR